MRHRLLDAVWIAGLCGILATSGCIFAVNPGEQETESGPSADAADGSVDPPDAGDMDVADGTEVPDTAEDAADGGEQDAGEPRIKTPLDEPCRVGYAGPHGEVGTRHIGVILPFSSDRAGESAQRVEEAIELAIEHLNKSGSFEDKQFAAIFCDSGRRTEQARMAVDQLVGAGVQAVVGPGTGVDVPAVVGPLAEEGVLTVIATNPSSRAGEFLHESENSELVWRTIPDETKQIPPLNELIGSVVEQKESGALGSILGDYSDAKSVEAENEVAAMFADELPSMDEQYKHKNTEGPGSYEDYQGTAERIVEARHDVVTLSGGAEIWSLLTAVGGQENEGPEILEGAVFLTHQRGRVVSAARDHIGYAAEFSRPANVWGTALGAPDPEGYEPYGLFAEAFLSLIDGGLPDGPAAPSAYDATVMIALATDTAESFSGAALAEELGPLVESGEEEVQLSKEKIVTIVEGRRENAPFNVRGASGPWEFDNAGGRVNAAVDLWCLRGDLSGEEEVLPVETQLSPVTSNEVDLEGARCSEFGTF
jgi:hypothetical protein